MLILALGAAFAFDPTHAQLQAVLDARLRGGLVDYAGLKAAPAALSGWLAEAGATPVATLSAADRTALWIDAYNALTLDLVADNWPLRSIRDLDGGKVWDTRKFTVGGETVTLNGLEGKLRALGDPRIHAALNCASKGCPPLAEKVFTGPGLEAQLEGAAARWAATATIAGGSLRASQIFEWYSADFLPRHGPGDFDIPGLTGAQEAAANFIAHHAPARAAELRRGGYTVAWAPYDWAVNATP